MNRFRSTLALAASAPVLVGVVVGVTSSSTTTVAGDPLDPIGTATALVAEVEDAVDPLPIKPKTCLDHYVHIGGKPPMVLHYCLPV